jgi:DNA-binding transcriptional ArsR family regulator
MRDLMAVTKALADENRVRIVMALMEGELCVCQVVELLELASSTVSKHMSILKQARLVDGRKDGRWMYYRLADQDVPVEAREATKLVSMSLSKDSRIHEDMKRLKQIRKVDPEVLCKQQNEC